MASPSVLFAVGETPAQVGGDTGIPTRDVGSVLVLNSSEGIGDAPGGPDIIVDTDPNCALSPQQIGIRLRPGQLFTFPMVDRMTGFQMQLFAVADGPGGKLTVVLNP